jgi:hypothetical protein
MAKIYIPAAGECEILDDIEPFPVAGGCAGRQDTPRAGG